MQGEPNAPRGPEAKGIVTQIRKWGKDREHNPSEFYSTPEDVTIALLDFLDLPVRSTIWEPAAGEGAMSKVMEQYQDKEYCVLSSDIRRTDYCGGLNGGIDFLQFHERYILDKIHDALITNPPFSLAEDFVWHAIKDLKIPTVCLLLKSDYWHAAKRQDLYKTYTPTYICPLLWRPRFGPGNSPIMNYMWCVWSRRVLGMYPRYIPLERPKHG